MHTMKSTSIPSPIVQFKIETRLPPGKTPADWAQIDREFTFKQALNRYAKAINAN